MQKRIEQRIDNAKYRKEIKKIIPKILKNIKKIKKINIENQKYSRNLNSEKSINISDEQLNKNISHIENVVNEILKLSCEWFQNNLNDKDALHCREYLKLRNLSKEKLYCFQNRRLVQIQVL